MLSILNASTSHCVHSFENCLSPCIYLNLCFVIYIWYSAVHIMNIHPMSDL